MSQKIEIEVDEATNSHEKLNKSKSQNPKEANSNKKKHNKKPRGFRNVPAVGFLNRRILDDEDEGDETNVIVARPKPSLTQKLENKEKKKAQKAEVEAQKAKEATKKSKMEASESEEESEKESKKKNKKKEKIENGKRKNKIEEESEEEEEEKLHKKQKKEKNNQIIEVKKPKEPSQKSKIVLAEEDDEEVTKKQKKKNDRIQKKKRIESEDSDNESEEDSAAKVKPKQVKEKPSSSKKGKKQQAQDQESSSDEDSPFEEEKKEVPVSESKKKINQKIDNKGESQKNNKKENKQNQKKPQQQQNQPKGQNKSSQKPNTKVGPQKLYEIQATNLPINVTEEEVKDYFSGCGKIAEINLVKAKDEKTKDIAYIKFTESESLDFALLLNEAKWKDVFLNIKRAAPVKSNPNQNKKKDPQEPKGLTPEERTARKVYVGNLYYASTEADIREFFSSCGEIHEIKLGYDKDGNRMGFAHVEFKAPESATQAVQLSGTPFMGRELKVSQAMQKKPVENQNKKDRFKKKGKQNQ